MQNPVCTGSQLDCAEKISPSSEGCQLPCTGIFADVKKTDITRDYSEPFQKLLESYESYKSLNVTKNDIPFYFQKVSGEMFFESREIQKACKNMAPAMGESSRNP